MVAAGHQTVAARRPARADVRRPGGGGGVDRRPHRGPARPAVRDAPGAEPRGLSWSDCAVLFRSVAKDAEPVVEELRRRGIPFVVKGLNRLFDSPEIQAVVGIFRFMVGEIDAGAASSAVGCGRADPGWRRLGRRRSRCWRRAATSTRGKRHCGLQHPAALPGLPGGAGAARGDGARATPARGELVFYHLGKFSQVISDFEQIHFTTEPKAKYEGFAKWLEHQAPELLRGRGRGRRVRDPGRRHHHDGAPGEGHAVAGRVRAAMRENRFPSRVMGGVTLRHVIPDDAIDDPDRYRGTRRGRDAAVLRRGDPSAEVPVCRRSRRWRTTSSSATARTSSTTSPRSSGSRRPRRRSTG